MVIRTYPRDKGLRCVFKSFNYRKACDRMHLENLGSDFYAFALRMFFCGKLYKVEADGTRGAISRQQNWQIHSDYLEAHYDLNSEGELLICNCSYPYYSALIVYSSLADNRAASQPLTCLVNDNGREIIVCPNCGSRLLVEEEEEDYYCEDEEYSVPATCDGCSNYHGNFYGDNQLICAIHPSGFEGESCPDYIA